jgi:hypothetical protein
MKKKIIILLLGFLSLLNLKMKEVLSVLTLLLCPYGYIFSCFFYDCSVTKNIVTDGRRVLIQLLPSDRQRHFNRVGLRKIFFSSTSERRVDDGVKSFNDFSGYVTSDGDRIINLPSIANEFEFKRDLINVLFLLDKEKEKYKLYYYLYLRTNDKNKELLSLLVSEN